MIAKAEAHHEERFQALLEEVEKGSMFKKESPVRWVCLNCGFVYEGTEPPAKCPACQHPQAWFDVLK